MLISSVLAALVATSTTTSSTTTSAARPTETGGTQRQDPVPTSTVASTPALAVPTSTVASTPALAVPTSTVAPPGLAKTSTPSEALTEGPPRGRKRKKRVGPGAWLPKVGAGLSVDVGVRFGVGDDASDSLRGDPPYGAVVDFSGTVRRKGWFARALWGFQVAGPEANRRGQDERQTFQPWEIGVDAGLKYSFSENWRVRPMAGLRIQPDRIGPSADTDLGVQLDVRLDRRFWSRAKSSLFATLRVVGRYANGVHDLSSDRRFQRSTCFLWGRRFLDCTLAFTLAPGTVGAEGHVRGRYGRFTGTLFGGWFIVSEADETGGPNVRVTQEDGDWTWLGLKVEYAAAADVFAALTVLTGGRVRDSLDQNRVPLFTSDLARTTFIISARVRL